MEGLKKEVKIQKKFIGNEKANVIDYFNSL